MNDKKAINRQTHTNKQTVTQRKITGNNDECVRSTVMDDI